MKYANYPPNKQIGDWVWNSQAKLGAGAFGKVFLGHPKNNKHENVAIKQMDMNNFRDPSMKQALENELMILRLLKGENTCGLLDEVKTQGNQYIIQMFCNGGDLRSFLTKRGKIPEKEAITLLQQILRGFKEMVDNDLAHRDVKPENTLIHNNVMKVADFGFSCKTHGRMMTEQMGTPLYMSPQLLMGQPYSMKNDIWAVGIMYYEMLFGKTPWDVRSQADLVEMPRRIPVKFPYGVHISEVSKRFIKGCLAFEERNRWGWSKIFQDQIFTMGQHQHQATRNRSVDAVGQKFLSNLQEIISAEGVSIDQIFSNFDSQGDRALECSEFTRIIQVIDPSCDVNICAQVFQRLDPNQDGVITYKEFYDLLQTEFNHNSKGNHLLVEARCNKILKNLVLKIYQDNLSIDQVMQYFDTNRDNQLSPQEFLQMIRSMDPQITNHESEYLFNKFDADHSGAIALHEFKKVIMDGLQRIQDKYFSQQQTNNPVMQLKNIVKRNNLNLNYVFRKFDVDGNQKMDFHEFSMFVKALDSRADQNVISNIFGTLDVNRQGYLTCQSLRSLF